MAVKPDTVLILTKTFFNTAAGLASVLVLCCWHVVVCKSRSTLRFTELLNKAWGHLKGCSLFLPLRKNRSGRSDFCGATVLAASSGRQVSFNTTVGATNI